MKTDWTLELDLLLVEAVEIALDAGYHEYTGPKRMDGIKPGFWTAVSVLISGQANPENLMRSRTPTPGACAARHKTALKNKIDSVYSDAAAFRAWQKIDEKWGDIWESVGNEIEVTEQERDDATHDAVMANNIMLRKILKDLGVECDVYGEAK